MQTFSRNVLVADDSVDVARRLCELLGEVGGVTVVGPAGDGTSALSLFHERRPDAAVLDVSMPGLDGIAVTRAIRAEGAPCLIVLCSNHADPSLRSAGLHAGADHFFHKTLELEALKAAIRQWIAGAAGPGTTDSG